ncbi:uncharacterized protein LOC108481851 [Gossypium arboreum]|uniref:uncharacterized protein LOC108481851 n=1 Tax=Gossypium arboreum TaxID=29729 RepID=UPI0008194EC1|nr:uncharacterized protein LOC108481851 [Gossypium arboreum]
MGKPQSSALKKSKKYLYHFISSVGYTGKDRGSQRSNLRSSAPSVASAGSVGNSKPRCKHCNKFHFGECRMRSGGCYRCGSLDHYLRDCPKKLKKILFQTSKPSNPALKGRPPRNLGNMNDSRGIRKDSIVKSEARPPARIFARRVREDASAPDVITGTFSLLDTDITF